jgi:secretion/DNA translocation related TadE-like protein
VRQHGSASTIAVVLASVLVVVALLATAVGGLVVDQRRAESAADLSALAGAAATQQGGAACPVAGAVAVRNGAHIAACHEAAGLVVVVVERATRLDLLRLLPGGATVVGSARAGPVGLVP